MMKQTKVIAGITFLYIAIVSAFMIIHRIWFSPDQFFVFALIGCVFLGRANMFIVDWGPFLTLFFGYEFLRGLVPFVSGNVHILPMIHFDEKLFGGVLPTTALQALFYTPTHLHWWDYFLVTLYICHFVTPMVVGFLFWLKDRTFFHNYALGILFLSYAGFITFALYPAMPPWMAAEQGFIPPIKEVTGHVMSNFLPSSVNVPSIYAFMRPNPVAAMPSLHAALPLLIYLFVVKKFGKWGVLFLPYVIGVWIAVLYLGEHYFADVLVGAVYAVVSFAIIENKGFLFGLVRPYLKKIPVVKKAFGDAVPLTLPEKPELVSASE